MKKSIKLLALGLAVVPCALVLTACGNNGDDNLVDISGKYTAVEVADYNTVIDEVDQGFNLTEISKGLKAVLTVKATADLGTSGKVTLNVKSEEILKGNPTENQLNLNDVEMYAKSTASVKMKVGKDEATSKATTKQYMKDGKLYLDMSGAVMDDETPSKYYMDLSSAGAESITIPDYKVADLLAMLPEGDWGEYVQISKSTTDDGFKVKVVATAETLNQTIAAYENTKYDITFTDDAEFYIIYSNGEFAGAYLDAKATVVLNFDASSDWYTYFGSTLSINVDANAQIVGYTGNITFPDFESQNYLPYEDMMA